MFAVFCRVNIDLLNTGEYVGLRVTQSCVTRNVVIVKISDYKAEPLYYFALLLAGYRLRNRPSWNFPLPYICVMSLTTASTSTEKSSL